MDADVEAQRWTAALRKHPKAPPLKPIQGLALTTAMHSAIAGPYGLFGMIGVGHGKTLLSWLLPEVIGAEHPVLLFPPAMKADYHKELAIWSTHYRFTPPHPMTYTELSAAKSSTALDWHAPDLLICDEAHALRDPTSARTKRFLRYCDEHPECRVVILSGTTTTSSLFDYSHLIARALHGRSPLPHSYKELELWEAVIGADGEPDGHAWNAVRHALNAGRPLPDDEDERRRFVRRLFCNKLLSTPGVVSTDESSCAAPLTLRARIIPVPESVQRVQRNLDVTWELPDAADESAIVDAATMARAASQVANGFFYRWDWGKTGMSDDDREWQRRRSAWNKAVRDTLRCASGPGYDSMLLVANACARGEGGREVQRAWRAWHEVGPGGVAWSVRPVPPTVTTWVDRYVVADVTGWLRSAPQPAIVWYSSRAMGEALSAIPGLPVHGQGSATPVGGRHHVAASINVHGSGKNLQAWRLHLVLDPPANGKTWEQLLGRSHRQGQMDGVVVEVFQHAQRHRDALAGATADAEYVEDTQRIPQKLCYATREGFPASEED